MYAITALLSLSIGLVLGRVTRRRRETCQGPECPECRSWAGDPFGLSPSDRIDARAAQRRLDP